ncbi:MAG TPA: M48 family metallopeptidase [Spirochaetales bacterium]|nr:M48 family metallopeptidase [Spirochaetales bacterium]
MPQRKAFPDIAPSAWEHPADRAALAAFSSLPMAAEIVRRFSGSTFERSYRLAFLASSARVSEEQFPQVRRLVEEAARVLDVSPAPEAFVAFGLEPNAAAYGVERPFIVVSSAALDFWDEAELLAVLGHEMGHVASGHAAYKTLLALLLKAGSLLGGGLLGGAALAAARAALLEWDRKSELSADRAGLLACQDPQASYRALMKTAGGPRQADMDLNEFFRQARDYDASAEGLDSLWKLLDLLDENHPLAAPRMTALQDWEKGGGYEAVLRGEYPRRAEGQGEGGPFRGFEAARDSYARDFSASQDPLSQAAGRVFEALGGIFGQGRGATQGQAGGTGETGGPEGQGGQSGPEPGRRSVEELLDELFGKR